MCSQSTVLIVTEAHKACKMTSFFLAMNVFYVTDEAVHSAEFAVV